MIIILHPHSQKIYQKQNISKKKNRAAKSLSHQTFHLTTKVSLSTCSLGQIEQICFKDIYHI